MFEQLHALVKSVEKLTITMSAGSDGTMTVCVIPNVVAGKDPALAQPLVLRATPEELDAGFVDAVCQYQEVRVSLADQVAATTVVIEAAKKMQEAKAVKAVKGKPVDSAKTPAISESSGDKGDSEDDGDGDGDGNDDGDAVKAPPAPVVKVAPVHTGTDLSDLI